MYIFDEKQLRGLEDEKTGDLYIHFNITFPKFIKPDVKEQVIKILDNNALL